MTWLSRRTASPVIPAVPAWSHCKALLAAASARLGGIRRAPSPGMQAPAECHGPWPDGAKQHTGDFALDSDRRPRRVRGGGFEVNQVVDRVRWFRIWPSAKADESQARFLVHRGPAMYVAPPLGSGPPRSSVRALSTTPPPRYPRPGAPARWSADLQRGMRRVQSAPSGKCRSQARR